ELAEHRVEFPAADAAARGQGQAHAVESAHGDGVGEFEPGRGDQHDLLALERVGDQVAGDGQVGQAEVGPLVPDGADDGLAALAADDVHADARVLGRVGGQEPPRQSGLQAGGGGDAEFRVAGAAVAGEAFYLADGVERLPSQFHHAATL